MILNKMLEAQSTAVTSLPEQERPWKTRVEEPANRFLYYPVARKLVGWLVHTPVTPNQVTLSQPFIAGVAAYLISHNDWRYLLAGAAVFEFRSMLDCVDGTLARAKKLSSPNGHALDALCDWLSVVILYIGVYLHFANHPPPAGGLTGYVPLGTILALSLLQGACRSGAADYFLRKFGSIFATGRDATVEDLRDKQRGLDASTGFFGRVDAGIGRCQHFALQQEVFDAERTSSLTDEQIQRLQRHRTSPAMNFIARMWSISNGDFYIRLTVLSLLLGHVWMWKLQLFFASFGFLWIVGLVVFTSWYFRRVTAPDTVRVKA